MYDLAILGGGLAGLAAALNVLKQEKLNVVILEKEARPGGQAISLNIQDVITDLGPHRIHTEIPGMENFLRELLGPRLIRVKRRSRMFLRGDFIHYPPKLRELIKKLGLPRLIGFAGDSLTTQLRSLVKPPDSQNYEAVMIKTFGRRLYDFFFYPYSKKTWCWEPGQLSADIINVRISTLNPFSILRNLFSLKKRKSGRDKISVDEFIYVKGGIEVLPQEMAGRITELGGEIITDAEVKHIYHADGSLIIEFSKADGSERITARQCVSTIPVTHLINMLQQDKSDKESLRAAQNLRYIAMILVFIVVNKGRISPDTWLYFPESDVVFNRAYETKNFDPELGPKGKSAICAEITCFKDEDLWQMPDGIIIDEVIKTFARTRLFSAQEISATTLYRLEHAYPLYQLNYQQNLLVIWKYLSQFDNLITIGRQGLFHHNNMDHSIFMGQRAADYVLKNIPSAQWYGDLSQFAQLRIID